MPIDFVHVFEAHFWSLSNLQLSLYLHLARAPDEIFLKSNDIMMTSSCDLLRNFEYLISPIDFVHRFEGVFSSPSGLQVTLLKTWILFQLHYKLLFEMNLYVKNRFFICTKVAKKPSVLLANIQMTYIFFPPLLQKAPSICARFWRTVWVN